MKEKIRKIVGGFYKGFDFDVLLSEREGQGHYSTNLALRRASLDRRAPMDIAEELVSKVRKSKEGKIFEKVEAAEPGFINFWLAPDFLKEEVKKIKRASDFGARNLGKKRRVIFEYSDPNIAKRMHVGHLRATIIGNALSNIYDFLGYKVVRWNYIGDWGTQFGKMIAAYKLWGNKNSIEADPVGSLQDLYVKFHEEMKWDSSLEDKGREEFRKLEEGDEENERLWEWFRRESLREFNELYEILGVKFDLTLGEAFYRKEVKKTISDLKKRRITQESEGSLIINLDKFGLPPALIQKADGASLYLTRDIPNIKYRISKYKPMGIYYVVGNEQALHFEQLFAVAGILGWDKKVDLKHIKYGLVLGEDKKKLATREGKTIHLRDLISRVVNMAHRIVVLKNSGLNEAEKKKVARMVGVGALKYYDLKENRQSDIVFDWDRMLDLRGNSAPYLLYTYARLSSILRKGEELGGERKKKVDFDILMEKEELDLMRKILEFPDVVLEAHDSLMTSGLAKYLYELANLSNRFYERVPVLSPGDKRVRIARTKLVETTAAVLGRGLGLLGIEPLENI